MSPCLDDSALLEIHGGEGTASEREHLRACGTCVASYERLRDDLMLVSVALDALPLRRQRSSLPRWTAPAFALAALALLAVALRVWQQPDTPVLQPIPHRHVVAFADEVSRAIFADAASARGGSDDLARLQAALGGGWPCDGNPLYAAACDTGLGDDLDDIE